MRDRSRLFLLTVMMSAASLLTAGTALGILYRTALGEERTRLKETAGSQGRLIAALGRYDSRHGRDAQESQEATLSQVIDAHRQYEGFGKTGEFTLARREAGSIVFLLRHRHGGLDLPNPVSFASDLAEPMRRALSGKTGTMMGRDYKGEKVLAAYEPIQELDWGVVAQIDLSEIRAPFVRAGTFAGGLGLIIVLAGAALFLRTAPPSSEPLQEQFLGQQKLNEELRREITQREDAEQTLRRFASIVESSDDAILSKTLDGIILSWNKAAEKLYGFSAEEMEGKSVSILVPQNMPDEVPEILARISRGERVDYYETVRQRKDGSLVDVSLMCSPLFDESGNIVGASAIARNISEPKQAEVALRSSAELFRHLVENSPTGISIVQDDVVVYQNSVQEEIFGPLPRLFKLKDLEGIHPDDAEAVKEMYASLASGKRHSIHVDFRYSPTWKDAGHSKIKWIKCRARVGEYAGKTSIFVNVMDTTRAKELENLIRTQDKMSSLGRVAAGLAHEIRNPLSGINIYLNTLQKIYDKADQREKVEGIISQILSASRKIESIIRRVMDFAKPSAPEFSMTDLTQPIGEALRLSSVTLRKAGIEVEKILDAKAPLCYADANLMEQVILNLITNAVDAMRGMDGEKRLKLTCSVEGNAHVIVVSDSGPGVPPSLRENLFDPFFTTKNGGTGIGLSLVHRIIADHGGKLDVAESEWGGAEFRIELPFEDEARDSDAASPDAN